MKNKIIGLLSISFVALIIVKILREFTNLIPPEAIIPNIICLYCVVIPALAALWIYRKSVPRYEPEKRVVLLIIFIIITLALLVTSVVNLIVAIL